MTLKSQLRSLTNRALARMGLTLARVSELEVLSTNRWDMEHALGRLAQLGLLVETIIDVGAARGEWSWISRQAFPQAGLLMVEALEEHRAELEVCVRRLRPACAAIIAASDSDGTINLNVSDDLDGSGIYGESGRGKVRTVPSARLDTLVQKHKLRPPYLLKLDTHGYEIPILAGAETVLKNCVALVIEAYNFRVAPNSFRFWELCALLARHGFRPADVAGFMARRTDGLFWQMDVFFLRDSHPAFKCEQYA